MTGENDYGGPNAPNGSAGNDSENSSQRLEVPKGYTITCLSPISLEEMETLILITPHDRVK